MHRNGSIPRRFSVAAVVSFALLCAGMASAGDEADETNAWSGEISASFSALTGTVDTIAAGVDATGERAWTDDTLTLRFTGTYGRTRDRKDNPSNDSTQEDSQALTARWKHLFGERYFWATGTGVSRDSTQDREVRYRLNSGPGYRFWMGEDADARHFDMAAGLGYRYELYDGNTGPVPGSAVFDLGENGYDRQYADVVVAFEYKNLFFEDRVEWTHTGSFAMPVNSTDSYIGTTEVIIGIPLTAAWSFRTTFMYEYTNDVPDDVNSSLTRTTLGLGYKF
jgi:hypothetical protein